MHGSLRSVLHMPSAAAAEALELLRRLTELLKQPLSDEEREIIKDELQTLADRL